MDESMLNDSANRWTLYMLEAMEKKRERQRKREQNEPVEYESMIKLNILVNS